MVTVLKDIPVPGVEVIPCRLNGPRGIVKAFLLHDDAATVLVDTGFSDADADLIVERLARIGRSPADLTMCVLTHRHGDHVGGLKKLRGLGNFAVVAHEDEAKGVEQTCGVAVERTVKDGDELPEIAGIRIVHMPGHTPGSIALYLHQHRAFVAGDAIVSAGEHLVVSPAFLCDDPDQARQSVKRLLGMALPIDHMLVAHGDDVYGKAGDPLARILVERRAF
ncbi:MAG TPA: MBL fold metallo-hydrolase [Chloroflexota bacterium]|nr:MBL fold metallo-hydrolase [Chloroflexota bacterium]